MIIGLIPSRLKSKRLFEKPLIKINGFPIIVHTMKRAMMSKTLDDLYVCTDSEKIANVVQKYGGKFILTSSKHRNGTERIAEAIRKIKKKTKLIVDIQGDEPTIKPKDIDEIVKFHKKNLHYDVVIPHFEIDYKNNSNHVKIISDKKGKILYLTRSISPYNFFKKDLKQKKHLSVISFKKDALLKYTKFNQSYLEKIEGIELLRCIENNQKVGTFRIKTQALSMDVKKDIFAIKKFFKTDKIRKLY
tara:strand:- start:15951 stop:16688 length:738 start_codon:yes stop_codon:yes gene_type:complete